MTMSTARPSAPGTPEHSESMPREAESAPRARHLVVTALDAWGLQELVDAGTLIVTELVANVVSHTRCPVIHVALRRPVTDVVRIAVTDNAPMAPRMGEPGDDAQGGRGLVLVDALSDRWGCTPQRVGKAVWAELRVQSEQPAQRERR